MTCGVYQIKNKLDGKTYIGSSADIERRWESHKNSLRIKRHANSKLQEAWDKYGEESFIFEILSVMEYANLKNEEQNFINHLSEDKSYNKRKTASRPKCLIQDNALNNPTCIHPGCNRVLYSKGKDEHGNTRYRCLNGHSQRVKPTPIAFFLLPRKSYNKNQSQLESEHRAESAIALELVLLHLAQVLLTPRFA